MQQNYNGTRNENIQAVFTHLSVNIFLSFFVWVCFCVTRQRLLSVKRESIQIKLKRVI